MVIFGLTGPSGSGKAVVGEAFTARGIPVLDTDAVYHFWIASDTPCTRELRDAFGVNILAENGGVDRRALAARVFCGGDEEKRRLSLLNAITHKYVIRSCEDWIGEQKTLGKAAAVIDAPLLIESALHKKCDCVLAVLAPKDKRLARIMRRDGLSHEAAEARISAQPSDDFYREHADFVFLNDGERSAADRFVTEKILKYIPDMKNDGKE